MIKHIIIASLCLFMAVSVAESQPLSKCLACHSTTHKVKMCTGLQDLYGAPAGKAAGVRYSKAFGEAQWTWDDEHLRKWICNSKTALREFSGDESAKSKMPNMRICDPLKQDKVIEAMKKLTTK